MAQAPKLTAEQWADVRTTWERDSRDGFTWLVRELDLPVTAPAVRKRALSEEWAKGAKPAAGREKPTGKTGKKPAEAPAKPAPAAKKPRQEKPAPETLAGKPETIETMAETIDTMDDDAWDAMDGEDWAGDAGVSEPNARTARGGAPLVGVLESLDFEDAGFCDLLEAAGRGKYDPKLAGVVNRLAKLGLTHPQMADVLGVAESTFYKWKAERADFRTALQMGMAVADAQVTDSMYRAACGYTHEEEVIRVLADGTIVRVPTMKHYPPNPNLIMFWLKNRQPELWKERVEIKEQPTIALVDKQAMNEVLQRALDHAAEVKRSMLDRPARLGLTIDQGEDDGD